MVTQKLASFCRTEAKEKSIRPGTLGIPEIIPDGDGNEESVRARVRADIPGTGVVIGSPIGGTALADGLVGETVLTGGTIHDRIGFSGFETELSGSCLQSFKWIWAN